MTIVVDGKNIAQAIHDNIAARISKDHLDISFHVVYVGSDPVIDNFVAYKEAFGRSLGIDFHVHRFEKNISEGELLSAIADIEQDADAMIVQLPLPQHLNTQTILDAIPASKDVDVLSTQGRKAFVENESNLIPPVTGAIVEVFVHHNLDLDDKKIVLVGNGSLVGQPMAGWLDKQSHAYTIIDKETPQDISENLLQEADIIISGAGVPGLITPEKITTDVILIDAGTSESGKKILGDIDRASYAKSSLVTPVPGGIGPITIAVLYQNILKSYDART